MDVAVLVDIIKETDKNWRFIFESPLYDRINFISGQLVQLSIPDEEDKGYYHKRNYSIASWPDGTNRFELIITYLEKGRFSELLFKNSKIGDEFLYKGPMGIFTLPEILTRDVYFVSTGSGISPFRSMLNYIAENKVPTGKLKLFFGTRTEKDIVYYEEMKRLEKAIPNFEYVPVLSREEWDGAMGYVHDHYIPLVDKAESKPLIYYCGWKGMIDEGRSLLKERGFKLGEDIRIEIFG
jgi:NAD(P)H-flavin reductase